MNGAHVAGISFKVFDTWLCSARLALLLLAAQAPLAIARGSETAAHPPRSNQAGSAPEQPYAKGTPTTCMGLPSIGSGLMRFITSALALTQPRFDPTRTQPPF